MFSLLYKGKKEKTPFELECEKHDQEVKEEEEKWYLTKRSEKFESDLNGKILKELASQKSWHKKKNAFVVCVEDDYRFNDIPIRYRDSVIEKHMEKWGKDNNFSYSANAFECGYKNFGITVKLHE